MPGARCTRGLACNRQQVKTHTSIQVSGGNPTFPAQWLYGLYRALLGERIRLVTVAAGLIADRIRLDRFRHRQLGTSNGCRNHTVLPYATTPFVCAPFDRSRVWLNPKPALQFTCALNAAASTASHPNVRDDGQRPFLRDRMAGLLKVICPTAKAKFCPSGYFVAGAAQQVRCGVPTFDRSSRP